MIPGLKGSAFVHFFPSELSELKSEKVESLRDCFPSPADKNKINPPFSRAYILDETAVFSVSGRTVHVKEDVLSSKTENNEKPFSEIRKNQKLNSAQLHLEEEVGDLLLSVINYARWMNIDAEIALNRANLKFCRRFSFVEDSMKKSGISMTEENRGQMLNLWKKAKE